MQHLTLGMAKLEFARIAGLAGMNQSDDRLTEYLNYVRQVYWPELNYPPIVERIRFCNYEGCIALPLDYEVALRFTIKESQTPIASKWYEFMPAGPGRQDGTRGWTGVPIDRGESPVIRQPDTSNDDGGQYVRAYALADERVAGVRPSITILGYDTSGRWVRSYDSTTATWSDGEALAIDGDTSGYRESTTKWSRIVSAQKPRTNKGVELFYRTAGYDDLYFAARYHYNDRVPMFRIYFCPGVAEAGQFISVHALCRRRYRPVVDDNDLMYISNSRAIRLGLSAAKMEESTDPAAKVAAAQLWNQGIASLRADAEAFTGDQFPRWEAAELTGFGETNPVL